MNTTPDLVSLLIEHTPVTPSTTVAEVADLFNQAMYRDSLSVPVVENTVPVGVISRYHLFDLFINPYGRDLHGKKPIHKYMNTSPLIISLEQSMEEAAQYVSLNMSFPLTEDFIITENGSYRGIGFVLHLLRDMEARVAKNAKELNRAYRELKSSQAQLVQSEKMASLGQMVAGVAHEINTPLGYVKNNVQMTHELFSQSQQLLSAHNNLVAMLGNDELDEAVFNELMQVIAELGEGFSTEEDFTAVHELFADTLYGVEQISELVLNLKNFSRLDQAKVADVNLNDCIDSALLIGKNNIKHKAEIIKDYQELPAFEGSPSQINQVFLNLVNNAVQAIEHERGKILIKTFHDDNYICATVEDNGKGIPADKISSIFDPFFTTKAIGEGTGLGLSISYKIIEDHGGKIRVVSKPGIGTKFLIAIPRKLALKKAS